MNAAHTSAAELADAVIQAVGRKIVLGLPVGIGKALHVADALFARAVADDSITLSIFSGLTLETPHARGDLERRFLEPLIDRLYAKWPTPAYMAALRRQQLPHNITVREFYLRPGAYLGNPLVQRNYTSINYSQVASELISLGVNVIAQLIATRPESPGFFSLSSNPEVTLDLLPLLKERAAGGAPVALVGQVNRQLPYMTGKAELPVTLFDFVLDSPACEFPLFPLPNRRVGAADYATAMHVASLVPDGATLQIGIGSLSDAVAHCLKLRHDSPQVFSAVLELLPGGTRSNRRQVLPVESAPFRQGLFASTELLSDALFALFEAGLISRPADDRDDAVIHAGFFIGSERLYDKLRTLGESERRRISMQPISYVNTLFGDEQRKRLQRRDARFVNETMMVTLLGAAASDTLEDGRTVSGVGGQFDFVSMAQSLHGSQSILMCRARRDHRGIARSNIHWSLANTTVPRHHRDIFVSEYGIAATRGRPDEQVIDAMLSIADFEFQANLSRAAQAAGKVAANYAPAADTANNTPEAVRAVFDRDEVHDFFPAYPLGTELTAEEQDLAEALGWLQKRTARPSRHAGALAKALLRGGGRAGDPALTRLQLDYPASIREAVLRRLVGYALTITRA